MQEGGRGLAFLGWRDGGWTRTNGDGVLTYWDESDASAVRIRYGHEIHEVPVENGYFFFCKWNVPESPGRLV